MGRLASNLRSAQVISVLMVVLLGRVTSLAEAQVYVANSLGSPGTLSVIDTVTNTETTKIPLGNFPFAVAVRPDGKFVYVTNQNDGTVSVVNAATNTTVGLPISVGVPAMGLAATKDGQFVHVVAAGAVKTISTASNTLVGSPIQLPIGDPYGIAVSPDGQFAYVTDQFNNATASVNIVNLSTRSVVGQTVGGSFPRADAVRPDGKFVYVTAFKDGALQVFCTSDNTYMGGGPSGGGYFTSGPVGVAISPDNGFAYVANQSHESVSIFPLSLTGGAPTSLPMTVALPSPAFYLDVTPDGKFVYVTHGAKSVSVINTATKALVGPPITVGSGPQGIAVSPLASPPPPSPPALSASLGALPAAPATVNVGQSLTVTMTVSNTGGSAATGVTAQSSLSLSGTGAVTQTSGPSPGPTTIGAGGSQAFTYTYSATAAGTVTFSGSASGGGVTSNTATSNAVTIQAPQLPPTLSVAPGSLNFTAELGLADPAPQSVQVANAGSGTLGWSATRSVNGNGNWLNVGAPTGGTAPPTGSVSVVASTCGLPAAMYTGSVVVSASGASGSPKSLPVTLVVTQPATTPPSPQVRVCADGPAYKSGDTVKVSVSVRRGTTSNTGDAYLFAAVPGTATYVSLVTSPGGFALAVGSAPIPVATNFNAYDGAGELFRFTFGGSEPAGTYKATAVMVPPGADPLVPANALAMSTMDVSFSP